MDELASSPSTSRVARRRGEARDRLVKAAAEIIATKGTDGLRLREITERADIGFGSFYTHFETKEELIEAVAKEMIVSFSADVIADAADLPDSAEAVAVVHRWFIRLATSHPQVARLIVNLDRGDVLLQSSVMAEATAAIERGIHDGRFRPVEVGTTVAFLVGATMSVMRGVLEGRLDSTADVASAEAFLGALGVAPDEAAEIAGRKLPSPAGLVMGSDQQG